MSRIPLIYHTNIKFYTQYTHPMLICRGADGCTHARTDGHTENIYSIFRDKLLLLGEHVLSSGLVKAFSHRSGSALQDVYPIWRIKEAR